MDGSLGLAAQCGDGTIIRLIGGNAKGDSVNHRIAARLAVTAALMIVPLGTSHTQDYPAQDYPAARPILSSGTTVAGETIHYPTDSEAQVTAAIINVAPGQRTGWHRHGVPLFAYILAGELTVDYGTKGIRNYKSGDGFLEAMNWPHDGRNTGTTPVSILVVYMGAKGAPQVLPEK